MPLQHIHDEMLEAMRRETSRAHIEELISRLRSGIPGAGHSHDAHRRISVKRRNIFSALIDFIEATLASSGSAFFATRKREGSRRSQDVQSAPVRIKNRRYREAMQIQQANCRRDCRCPKGATVRVLVDQPRIASANTMRPRWIAA